MKGVKHDVSQMVKDKAELREAVASFSFRFSKLENEMAALLHKVLFAHAPYTESRVAHAIYFSPDGFYPRQNIVNNAVTEWFREHPNDAYDFLGIWDFINDKLRSLRGDRNLLAHGSVEALIIREKVYVRIVPPTYSPALGNLVEKGTIPGKSIDDMRSTNERISAVTACVLGMATVIHYHGQGEPTLKETYDELRAHRNRLDSLFPSAQKKAIP